MWEKCSFGVIEMKENFIISFASYDKKKRTESKNKKSRKKEKLKRIISHSMRGQSQNGMLNPNYQTIPIGWSYNMQFSTCN